MKKAVVDEAAAAIVGRVEVVVEQLESVYICAEVRLRRPDSENPICDASGIIIEPPVAMFTCTHVLLVHVGIEGVKVGAASP